MTPPPTTPTPAIDFAAIRSSCPRAFAAYETWYLRYSYAKNIQEAPVNHRHLYDFFDEQGLYVVAAPDLHADEVTFRWNFAVRLGEFQEFARKRIPTRAAAEAAAFTAGFERLEQMLNQREG